MSVFVLTTFASMGSGWVLVKMTKILFEFRTF